MKLKYLITSILLTLLSIGVYAQEPYVVIDQDGTATFYYKDSKPEGALPIKSSFDDANWPQSVCYSVKKVVFDASFKDYRPTSCSYWFYYFENLTEISGMKEYLNTENVTSMRSMFFNCRSLTTLDLSNFNTANATNLSYMFQLCQSITSLDLSNFNTENVTDMNGMFINCDNLTTLNISKFNTAKVMYMDAMFAFCHSLTTLDISNFNTENVTKMDQMFDKCYGLTSLDLSKFNTTKVWDMERMFAECSNLKTIYVGEGWTTASVTSSEEMFSKCFDLYGENGSSYDEIGIDDASLAKIDGGKSNPGYLTQFGKTEYVGIKPYVVLNDGVATFYYGTPTADALKLQREIKNWSEDVRKSVKKVVFDASFKDYKPTSGAYWFWNFSNLDEISGMKEYLNTENITDMAAMFYGCKFKSLDLSSFNTEKVTSMSCMFKHSSYLETIDLSSFDTKNITDMAGMFENCSSLSKIDLHNFNTASVTSMRCMFLYCSRLKSLDLSSFNTEKVRNIDYMFQYCYNLQTIYVDNGWVTNKSGISMFHDCTNLYGGKGTAYNWDNTDGTYAHIDGGEENPGYFTKTGAKKDVFIEITTLPAKTEYILDEKLNVSNAVMSITFTGRPTITKDLDLEYCTYDKYKTGKQNVVVEYQGATTSFEINITDDKGVYCEFDSEQGLSKIMYCNYREGLRHISNGLAANKDLVLKAVVDASMTEYKPTSCSHWFYDYSNLTEIEGLSNINTSEVTDMSSMFSSCDKLTSLDLNTFNTENVKTMKNMFAYCVNLETIYVSQLWTTSNIESQFEDMFFRCEHLVGGKGTAYSSNKTDRRYAYIDGGEYGPGYLTEKLLSPTPVSSVDNNGDNVKVWSYAHTIYIASTPDSQYKIIDLQGRLIKLSTTKSSYEEVNINKSGILVVIINGKSYKVSL